MIKLTPAASYALLSLLEMIASIIIIFKLE